MVSIISRILFIVSSIIVRRFLIQYIGNEANGLYSLFKNITDLLNIAELGIGSAIVFSMYRPIMMRKTKKVAALYNLYTRIYRVSGVVVFSGGVLVTPFLPRLINDYESIHINVYMNFLLMLFAVTIPYLYGAKTSLIQAYKCNYITTGILTISRLFCSVFQIMTIIACESFEVFLICEIIEIMIIWLFTEMAVRKLHGDVVVLKERVDLDRKREIIRNVKSHDDA